MSGSPSGLSRMEFPLLRHLPKIWSLYCVNLSNDREMLVDIKNPQFQVLDDLGCDQARITAECPESGHP